MLYVVYGTDYDGARTRALTLMERVGSGYSREHITGEELDAATLSGLTSAASLFGTPSVLFFDTVSDTAGALPLLAEEAPALKATPHVCVVLERTLTAPHKKIFHAHAEEMIEVTAPPSQRFNTFGLADAFCDRNKKVLWLTLIDAQRQGISSEECVGVLHWQLKIIRLASVTASPEEADVKPHVYAKARRALLKYTKVEIDALASSLVRLYHEGHAGERDLGFALEAWVLQL